MEDHTVGNVHDDQRGRPTRGSRDKEAENTIGQKIPKRVRDEVEGKRSK